MSVRILTLLIIIGSLQDMATSSHGLQFIVGFMTNAFVGEPEEMELFIISHNPCDVTCRVSYYSVTDEYVVPALSSLMINLNASLMMTSSDYRETKGIAIDTNDQVSVFGMAKQIGNSDGFMAIPVNGLGKIYIACVYYLPLFTTQIALVGVAMDTSVSITLANNENATMIFFDGKFYNPGDSIILTVQTLDMVQIQSLGDLTGSRVLANKPISFFSGNYYSTIHSFGGGEPYTSFVEQLLPVEQWGTQFLLLPTPLHAFDDVIRIVVDVAPVTIQMTCLNSLNNDTFNRTFVISSSFQELSFPAGHYCSMESTEPVMVVKYAPNDPTDVDPTMTLVPAYKHFQSRYPFEAPLTARNTEILEIFLLFAVKEVHKDGLRLDRKALPDYVVYTAIPGTGFVAGFVTIEPGRHTFKNSYSNFMTLLYGREFAESYGFPLGMKLKELNTMEPQPFAPACVPSTDTNEQTTTTTAIPTTTAETSSTTQDFQNASSAQSTLSVVTDTSVLPASQDLTTQSINLPTTTSDASSTTQTIQNVSSAQTTLSMVTDTSTQDFTTQNINIPTTTACENCGQTTTAREQEVSTIDGTTYSPSVTQTDLPKTACFTMATCNSINQSTHAGCLQLCKTHCRPTQDTPFEVLGERVDPKQTSRYRRSLTSASDDRLSVVICGSVGGAILCCLVLGIVVLDLDNLMSMLRRIKQNVSRQYMYKPRDKAVVRI